MISLRVTGVFCSILSKYLGKLKLNKTKCDSKSFLTFSFKAHKLHLLNIFIRGLEYLCHLRIIAKNDVLIKSVSSKFIF